MRYDVFPFLLLILLGACRKSPQSVGDNGAFLSSGKQKTSQGYDLVDIQNGGELIVATLNGPDTYFDYQGQSMGLQYAFAADFATHEGLRLRMEIANDTLSLLKMLKNGEADIIALALPLEAIRKNGLAAVGVTSDDGKYSWAVRQQAVALGEALQMWYAMSPSPEVKRKEKRRFDERRQVRRKVRASYLSRERGVISVYDEYFHAAAETTGWDWRLIAAQCYQESGFDPSALSWAGACGLMQIMPSTARGLGLSADRIYNPKDNVAAAARYIKQLTDKFKDITDKEERVKFVLAAYNGGFGHVRDAMALARKYGRNAHLWESVSFYVLRLSEPKYYRDPVVKYGYMIGSETAGYVTSVLERYRSYGGNIGMTVSSHHSSVHASGARSHKRNRYSRERRIYSAEELRQQLQQ